MRPRRLKNEINVVPYIDVMLVLLVIFMVAAPMTQTGSVDLPSVEKANNSPPDNPLRVEVGADGKPRVGEGARPVSDAELDAYLRDGKVKNPKVAVLVAGDRQANYQAVLEVLDRVKALGFERVGLETRFR